MNNVVGASKQQREESLPNEIGKVAEVFKWESIPVIPWQSPESSLLGKVTYCVAAVCSLGLLPLAQSGLKRLVPRLVLPALDLFKHYLSFLDQERQNFLQRHPDTAQRLALHTPDGAVIDAIKLLHPEQRTVPPSDQKWMIYFPANGMCYEQGLEEIAQYGRQIGVNVLFFNYRGVVRSQGYPKKPEDLVMDGETAMQYLLSKVGVKSENILIHGRSLGGGVGAQVRAMHDGPIIFDRSFSTLTSAARAMVGRVAGVALAGLDWELDTVAVWDKIKGKKIIVYHPEDGMIKYQTASLHHAVKDCADFTSIALSARWKGVDPHNQPWSRSEQQAVVREARQALGLCTK